MARQINKQNNLAVLQVIKENKEVLFGAFQKNATNRVEKEDAWKEVLKKAQSLGLASTNRTWPYARDHLFGLWKSRAMAKRDNARKTGSGGGKEAILDEADNAILDILGRDSAGVSGLPLPESDGASVFGAAELSMPTSPKVTEKQRSKRVGRNDIDKLNELKKNVLESEFYKNKLQILELEKRLGLKRSKFTKEFDVDGVEIDNESENSNFDSLLHETFNGI